MKVIFVTCAVLLVLGSAIHQVVSEEPPTEPPLTDEQAACILDILENTEVNGETAGEIAVDVAQTFRRLIEHYQRCEAILSDPPSALEERRHE